MTIPTTIFVEEQVYGGMDSDIADTLLDAIHGGTGMDELTLAFLKEHEEQQELKTSTSRQSLRDEPCKGKMSASTKSDNSRKKSKRKKASKLARKVIGL